MKIIFRVDSSFKIGTGHLMRCLTLADELKKRGAEIEFISRDSEGNLSKLAVDKGYKVYLLPHGNGENEQYCAHASWLETSWQNDAEQTSVIAKGADWLVVDHYAIDARWEDKLRAVVGRIAVIDDLADRKHNCDLLLDQNYYAEADNRYADLVPKDCTLLLMPKYSLLRPEFAMARKKLEGHNVVAKKIMVFFGGVDADNNTAKALDALQHFEGEIVIVAGGANRNFPELESFCKDRGNFKLFKTAEMAELMVWADVAVGSGGSTNWERGCLGLPSFVWPIADNQVPILWDLNELGAVKLTAPERLLEDIANADLLTMSKIASSLTDGKGAARVANYIAFKMRGAEADDVKRIWEIRNEEVVRENSLGNAVIPFEAHQIWYRNSMVNPNRDLLVLADEKDIAGVLRFDVEGGSAEISIYLNPKHFELGLGENLLERGLVHIRQARPEVSVLTAQILENNLKSKALFAKFGFVENNGVWVKSDERIQNRQAPDRAR